MEPLDPDRVCAFLEQREGFLEGVVISGGEPTLQDDLKDLCARIKEMGYPVKLDTNGSRPAVLRYLLEMGLVDYVAMDLKTDPVLYRAYIRKNCRPESLYESIRLIMDSGVDHEFRTTCVKPIVGADTIENMARCIQGARKYVLQRFRPGPMLHPEFFHDRDWEYSDEELKALQALAQPWVQRCIIR